jgi:Flp pilus assembly protein TadG
MTAATVQNRHPRVDAQKGSASVELVLVTPLFVLVLLVVVALGRLAEARLVVADAAHQAARAASLARTEGDARSQAQSVVSTALGQAGASCRRIHVHVSTADLTPGASVTARVSCTADLGDLTRTGMPGRTTLHETAFSSIDTFRSSR